VLGTVRVGIVGNTDIVTIMTSNCAFTIKIINTYTILCKRKKNYIDKIKI